MKDEDFLVQSLEDNSKAMWHALQAEVTHFDKITAIATKVPNKFFNKALVRPKARLSSDSVALISHSFLEKKLPFSWAIPRSAETAATKHALEKNGLHPFLSLTSMYSPLENCYLPLQSASYRAEEVHTLEELKTVFAIYKECYEMPEAEAIPLFELHASHFASPKVSMHHYVGYLDNEAVGCALLLLGKDTAGIYNIGTVRSARKRGVGTMMVVALLDAAQKAGYKHAVLNAMPEAVKLYQKIGFSPLIDYTIYTSKEQK